MKLYWTDNKRLIYTKSGHFREVIVQSSDLIIKAIIFDIDGVLLDSGRANALFLQNVVEDGGYRRPAKREADKVFNRTLLDGLRI